MSDYIYHNELYHYGVKGMKWGVRRKKKSSKTPRKSEKRRRLTEEDRKIITRITANLLGSGLGYAGAKTLVNNTDLALVPGASFAAGLIGSMWGSEIVDNLFFE